MLSYIYTGNKTYFTYSIKELRNKKIVLTSDFSEMRSDGYEIISKSEFTFGQ